MRLRAVLPRLLLGLAVGVGALALALNRDRIDPAAVESAIRSLGLWGPVAHVALFALAAVLFVPGALFGLAGGILFGPILGALVNLTGATLGATAAFLIARYLAADWVRAKAGARLERLIQGVEAEGWRFVALMRLVPLVPFNFLNYALGLTRMPVTAYALTSLVCMIPGALAYAWLGHAGREAAAGNEAAIHYGLIGLALLVTVAFAPRLLRRFKGDERVRWIEAAELTPRLCRAREDGTTVIDVRGPDELAGPLGQIAGARNVPLPELPQRLKELAALAGTPVVLVCQTDRRSARAAALLDAAGFRNVRVLRGGMVSWNAAGLPLADRLAPDRPRGGAP
jgi:uncharacterized membrane protein YdjX (TVP38/TMEM64 family)/rhodanese-related sulfurtransferase